MNSAVHFGAGNIGRGFIGALLSQAGYVVTFADVNETIIGALAERREYTVEVVGESRTEARISPVTGLLSGDSRLASAIAVASLVTTAVGPNVLQHIAQPIAAGIEQRKSDGVTAPLNVVACENMIGASSALREEVFTHLDDAGRAYLEKHVGFPNSAVDRIVPPMEPGDDPLRVRVEEFSEWIVDEGGFIGALPTIDGMTATDNLTAFVERKLFTLNTGHAITAYLGSIAGHRTIGESIADPAILEVVRGAMEESGEVLIRRYGFDRDQHNAYIDKILSRFRNPWLTDDVQRVGRQPLRKLGFDDRFIKPLRGTIEYGTENRNLIAGIAAALYFQNEEDEQARELRSALDKLGVRAVIPRITSLDDAEIIGAIDNEYEVRGKDVIEHEFVRHWLRVVTVREAEHHFAHLVDEVLNGREVIVARGGKPIVRLTAVAQGKTE